MSNNLSVEQALGLLDRLKGTVHEFAAREDKLNQESSLRQGRDRQHREQATEELENKISMELADAETAFLKAKEFAESRYEARQTRINRAHRSTKDRALKRIEDFTGSRKYELQKKALQLEHDQETGQAATETNHENFSLDLALENEALILLEATARARFRGYRKFVRILARAGEKASLDQAADENQLLIELRQLITKSRNDLRRFGWFPLPLIFRFLPVWLLILLCPTPLVLEHFGLIHISHQAAIGAVVGSLAGVILLYFLGKIQAQPLAERIASTLGKARKLSDACFEKSETRYTQETERLETELKQGKEMISDNWGLALEEAKAMREPSQRSVDEKRMRVYAKNGALHTAKIERIERKHAANLDRLNQMAEASRKEQARTFQEREAKFNAEQETHWRNLETEWKGKILPIYEVVDQANGVAEKLFPAWQAQLLEQWTPPPKFAQIVKFGRMDVDVEKLSEATPKDNRLALPGPSQFSLPLSLTYPDHGSILFEIPDSAREEIISSLNNIILRVLSTVPAGKSSFTIIDPVGLGQNFAGIMHLADYDERLINSRIWTQSSQIEQKLGELNEHMEKIIQMYLRNEYQTIAEYNEQAGNLAEKYHFLVIADFPVNFSDTAVRRLLSIAASGARCGVYTLIHWDPRQTAPADFVADELRKHSVCLSRKGKEIVPTGKFLQGTKLLLDASPAPDFATSFVHKVGRTNKDSSRVEVPFADVAPPDSELWTEDTTSELRVAIGRTGATKLQYLAIGKGTRQHALMAGKTGSGKSTLFHVIITNLALWCSPEQVEFYLVDFKKGVEFKCYAAHRLPHARVVAIESDREFGLSVLQRIDEELKRRGEMFRKLGVQDLAGYKRAGGTEPVPRSLLLIDEFQEFFVEEDRISQSASVLLDRIVRQGRAFGIHVLLGSQTLGGAYTVARTTLGQMVIRIALQCNEADSYLIMDDSNPAPRLLSRPGEGIYNDAAGALEGNSPFQAVWLSDEIRDTYLEKVRHQADSSQKNYPDPIVFEGDAPAEVRENAELRTLLESESIAAASAAHVWLGAPNSIKGPTEALFQRQSGNNLLIVGQRDEAALAILSVALVSLSAQFPVGKARFVLFDGNPPGSPQREFLERVVQVLPHKVTLVKNNELAETMGALAGELKQRAENEAANEAPATFLFFNGLQKFSKLRYEEDFGFSSGDADKAPSPGVALNQLISEGPSLGFHVIAACDTYNNVNRFLNRKALTEFEMRVLFQMSATDSSSLIDSPKAGTLGLHRALYYNEQDGYLEVFRPYALPDAAWLEQAASNLSRLLVQPSRV